MIRLFRIHYNYNSKDERKKKNENKNQINNLGRTCNKNRIASCSIIPTIKLQKQAAEVKWKSKINVNRRSWKKNVGSIWYKIGMEIFSESRKTKEKRMDYYYYYWNGQSPWICVENVIILHFKFNGNLLFFLIKKNVFSILCFFLSECSLTRLLCFMLWSELKSSHLRVVFFCLKLSNKSSHIDHATWKERETKRNENAHKITKVLSHIIYS